MATPEFKPYYQVSAYTTTKHYDTPYRLVRLTHSDARGERTTLNSWWVYKAKPEVTRMVQSGWQAGAHLGTGGRETHPSIPIAAYFEALQYMVEEIDWDAQDDSFTSDTVYGPKHYV